MASFSELRDTVYTITNRPDLVNETTLALRKALFKFHSADSWKQDLNMVVLTMASHTPLEQWRWNIPLSTFPRHRRPKNLRIPPQDFRVGMPSSGNALFYPPFNQLSTHGGFQFLTEDNIFDSYLLEKSNYFYMAGASIYIKASWEPLKLEYWYYQNPLFSSTEDPNNISSWIADQFPDYICEEASSAVFKAIGKDDEVSRYREIFAENLQLLRMSDVGES